MPELQGAIGEVGITLQITRAETGKTEEVELVGFVNEEQLKALQAAEYVRCNSRHYLQRN